MTAGLPCAETAASSSGVAAGSDQGASAADRARLRLPAEALAELEEVLRRPSFKGLPIGPTLCSLMQNELLLGKARWNARARALDQLRWWRHHLLPERREARPRSLRKLGRLRGRYLLTWLADHPNYTNLVAPLVKELGPDQCSVIGCTNAPERSMPEGVELLAWSDLPRAGRGSWFGEYRQCASVWHEALGAGLAELGASPAIFRRLRVHLLCQARRIVACKMLLSALGPRAVITEYDRGPYSSCLVLAARALGIPSFTMLHGVIAHRFGYTPIVADRAFCWGERSRRTLLGYGADDQAVEAVGCQAVTRDLTLTTDQARRSLHLPADRPVALLATTPVRERARRKLVQGFACAFPPHSGISAVVRLHPSDRRSVYKREQTDHPQLRFLDAHQSSLGESLAAASVVICHSTAFGLDALVKRVPVVILDSIDEPLTWGRELVDLAGCPRVTTSQDLQRAVESLVSDPTERIRLLEASDTYLGDVYASYGQEAAARLARRIEQILHSSSVGRKDPSIESPSC